MPKPSRILAYGMTAVLAAGLCVNENAFAKGKRRHKKMTKTTAADTVEESLASDNSADPAAKILIFQPDQAKGNPQVIAVSKLALAVSEAPLLLPSYAKTADAHDTADGLQVTEKAMMLDQGKTSDR